MKIDLEQIYTLDFTMGLRFHPLIIRKNLPLLYVVFYFSDLDTRSRYGWIAWRF